MMSVWTVLPSLATESPGAGSRGLAVTDVLRLRQEALEWRMLEGEVVVLDLVRGEYLRVNGSGAGLWRLLADGAGRAELVRHLMEAYGLAEADADDDAGSFVADLTAKGLLEPQAP